MAKTRHIGLFGVGECSVALDSSGNVEQQVGNLVDYPPNYFTDLNSQTPVDPDMNITGDYNYMPIQMTLYNALRFFWGPKKWKISFNYNYNRDLSEVGYESGSFIKTNGNILISGEGGDSNSSANYNFHNLAENEKYLFCLADQPEISGFYYSWNFPVTYQRRLIEISDEEEEVTEDTITEDLFFSFGNVGFLQTTGAPLFSKDQSQSIENLWVSFYIIIQRRSAYQYLSVWDDYFAVDQGASEGGSPDESINATLRILGQDYTIKLGTRSIDDESITSEISDVVIEPTEWWSYDGLFNTSTGEKIEE